MGGLGQGKSSGLPGGAGRGQIPFPGGGQGHQAHAGGSTGGRYGQSSEVRVTEGPSEGPLTPNAECDRGWSPREEADVTTQDSLG